MTIVFTVAIAAVVNAGKLAMVQAVREYVVLASHLMLSHLAFGHRTPHADYLDHVAAVFAEPTRPKSSFLTSTALPLLLAKAPFALLA